MSRLAVLLAVACHVGGCSGPGGAPLAAGDGDGERGSSPTADAAVDMPEPLTLAEQVDGLDPSAVAAYLGRLAPMLVGRVLTQEERSHIAVSGAGAIAPIVDAWALEPRFADAARTMMEIKLAVSGQTAEVDFDLPGNTVAHVVRSDLPWSTILTSDTCFDRAGEPMPCDTGAPYAAGVLVTRAYMISRAGRFNLTRASTLMGTFACREYPIEDTLQPRVEKSFLKEMFRAESAEEQEDAQAAGGFGNGFACYTCHGQFSLHAQPFVRFDTSGLYHPEATGLQNPEGQLGESFDGLMASHFVDPAMSASEASQLFGEPVDDLADVGRVLGAHRVFLECSTRNILAYVLDLDRSIPIDETLFVEIVDRVLEGSPAPTYRELVAALFTEPRVILTVTGDLAWPEEGSP